MCHRPHAVVSKGPRAHALGVSHLSPGLLMATLALASWRSEKHSAIGQLARSSPHSPFLEVRWEPPLGSDSCSPPLLHPSVCPRAPPSLLPSLSQACRHCLSLCTQIVSVSAPPPPPKYLKDVSANLLPGKFIGICLESSGHMQLAVPVNPRGTVP